jgi:hypothetical protein
MSSHDDLIRLIRETRAGRVGWRQGHDGALRAFRDRESLTLRVDHRGGFKLTTAEAELASTVLAEWGDRELHSALGALWRAAETICRS